MKMNITHHVAVTGVALLVASAGILHPIFRSVGELEAEILAIGSEQQAGENVHDEFVSIMQRMSLLEERMAQRSVVLCPNTPEAHQQFETALLHAVQECGMRSIRTDRQTIGQEGDFQYLNYELAVEGDAQSLLDFLVTLESMQWITRIRSLAVNPGDAQRRITLQIAVMLEQ